MKRINALRITAGLLAGTLALGLAAAAPPRKAAPPPKRLNSRRLPPPANLPRRKTLTLT